MNIVRELRKKAGIQQKELAIEIGVSNATVSDWEHGKKDPTGERLKRLADYFGVDELVILGAGTNGQPATIQTVDPIIAGVSETDQILQQVLEKLNDQMSQSPEIKAVSYMMETLPQEQQEQIVSIVRAIVLHNEKKK